MKDYGCDKPDVRFDLKHFDVTNAFINSEFKSFAQIAETGLIKAMFLPESVGSLARKELESMVEVVKSIGCKGFVWAKTDTEKWSSGIAKFITPEVEAELNKNLSELGPGTWLFVEDENIDLVHQGSDHIRRHLGSKFNLYDENEKAFLWVDEFPLYEYDEKDQRFYAKHHPFTMPIEEDIKLFKSTDANDWKKCRAAAYDVVLNGFELGGGSQRIHKSEIQSQMFKILGLDDAEVEKQFGFFIEALSYGSPPHAGIAFGLDRMVMLLTGAKNISDVIAFPKTTSASDLMSGAPTAPKNEQLKELSFKWELK